MKAFSRKGRRKQSFHVRYKDFLKYCEKMDGLWKTKIIYFINQNFQLKLLYISLTY